MATRFLLFTEPRWRGFRLAEEGKEGGYKFTSIAEALTHVRRLPGAKGATLVVFDDKGHEMAHLNV